MPSAFTNPLIYGLRNGVFNSRASKVNSQPDRLSHAATTTHRAIRLMDMDQACSAAPFEVYLRVYTGTYKYTIGHTYVRTCVCIVRSITAMPAIATTV